MRIFLDAYFDNNFGDDLFIDLLLKRYPDVLFYTFWKKTPQNVVNRASRFSNLVILPGDCMMQTNWNYDAYVMIGGDVLPDGVDYSERICRMKHVKECGGFVALLGFSLYEKYGEKTIADLQVMAKIADAIVIRDKVSAERFKTLVPDAQVTEATDMVFTTEFGAEKYKKDNVLGIIPRRKLYSTDEEHWAYCRSMAAVTDAYLKNNPEAGVRFLAYSTGEYDDRVTATDIIGLMKDSAKAELVAYGGEINTFLQAIGSCSALIPTRFHGLVLALIFRIPFVAVPYEVKITQLLNELNYNRTQIPYGKEITTEQIEKTLEELKEFRVRAEKLSAYEGKATRFFHALDNWKKSYKESEAGFCEMICSANAERAQLQSENQFLKQQQAELEKWIEALKQERVSFEQQNQELEQIRQQQLAQIEELMKWIESLKKERVIFERQNLELESIRQWQAEKLTSVILSPAKVQREYDSFLQALRKKLDNQFGL